LARPLGQALEAVVASGRVVAVAIGRAGTCDQQRYRYRLVAFRQQQAALQHAAAGIQVQGLIEQGLRLQERRGHGQ